AVENTIEPGSTMKIFTLAAAIEENKWDPNATFKSGQYTLYDRTIRDHVRGGWGTISFLEGFQRSSNVSMAYLLERLGDREFIKYMEKFGFGAKTGIDLPKESAGVILDRFPSERLTTSYGQGSTVTPMQMM
ncbi:penicillin-binding protein, partial [Microvirga sp. 3-52]|nr:penicillin-binding protein [Microvirga sp. 3-52]